MGQAFSAMIQRMYRLENAVTLQSAVNEALVKIIRDDTQMKVVYDTVIENITGIEGTLREFGMEQVKLRSSLSKLGDHVKEYVMRIAMLYVWGALSLLCCCHVPHQVVH